jgi:hypothetical protein
MSLRRIGGQLGVHHQRVTNWALEHTEKVPAAPLPEKFEAAEIDGFFTLVGDKKSRIYLITNVGRGTRCVLGWNMVFRLFLALPLYTLLCGAPLRLLLQSSPIEKPSIS